MTYYRDVRHMKLATGDEILTEVTGEDQNEYLISNPLMIHKEKVHVNGTMKEANFFTRWLSLSNNREFIVQKYHVIAEGIVENEVADHYNNVIHGIDNLETVTEDDIDQEPDMLADDQTDEPIYH
jgi:ABC-type sulfate transport system substrate-binding protein